jgi:hypothetical protein
MRAEVCAQLRLGLKHLAAHYNRYHFKQSSTSPFKHLHFPDAQSDQIAAVTISTLEYCTPLNLGCAPNMLVQIARVDTGHARFPTVHATRNASISSNAHARSIKHQSV